MGPGLQCHGLKYTPIGYILFKYECRLVNSCQNMDLWKTKMILMFLFVVFIFMLFMIMKSDTNKLICILVVHLSSIIL